MFSSKDHLSDVIGPVFAAMISFADMKDARTQSRVSTTAISRNIGKIEDRLKGLRIQFLKEAAAKDYPKVQEVLEQARIAAEELFQLTGDKQRFELIMAGLREAQIVTKASEKLAQLGFKN